MDLFGVPNWKLDVHVNAGQPFDATVEILTYTPPATGSMLGVRYDPAKPSHVALADTSPETGPPSSDGAPAAAFASAGGPASRTSDGVRTNVTVSLDGAASDDPIERAKTLADLDRMRAAGQLTQAEFDSLERGILGDS